VIAICDIDEARRIRHADEFAIPRRIGSFDKLVQVADLDYYATEWRGRLDGARGGELLSQAIHAHDLLTHLLGPVASVFARTATRVNPVEVEDCAVASLLMANGALAALSATLGSQKEISRLRLCFENLTFESAQTPYAPGDDP
jgi:predicted dehydrogenase